MKLVYKIITEGEFPITNPACAYCKKLINQTDHFTAWAIPGESQKIGDTVGLYLVCEKCKLKAREEELKLVVKGLRE